MEVKLVDLATDILECKCSILPFIHCHSIRCGDRGNDGNGICHYWHSEHYTNVVTTINSECNCYLKEIKHTHIITKGPRGVEGYPYNYKQEQKKILQRYCYLAIQNCRYCDIKENHHHVCYEGEQGTQGIKHSLLTWE